MDNASSIDTRVGVYVKETVRQRERERQTERDRERERDMQLASQPPQFRGARGARSSRSIAPPRACCSTSGRDSFAAAASGGRRGDTRVRATNGGKIRIDESVVVLVIIDGAVY